MSSGQYTKLKNEEEELKPPEYSPLKEEVPVIPPSGPLPSSACPPSYDQAEKLKNGESVDYDVESLSRTGEPQSSVQVGQVNVGGYCEFFIFFVVCMLFGWIGYLFSCCFMCTVAASSGAAAGFGLSLIKTAVLWNVYHYDLWYRNAYDYNYYYDYIVSGDTANQTRTTVSPTYEVSDYSDLSVFNWLLWILAFCGFLLFVKSLIVFGRAKRAERSLQD